MSEGSIDYRSESAVAVIRINRPAKRNAMTALMCDQLEVALKRLRDSDDRVGVICAEGEMFCAGADLSAPPPHFWRAVPDVGVQVGKPVIAAVQGAVVGMAVTMISFCDLCVASEDARFLYPEARIGVSKGLISGLGSRIPHKVAMELMLTGGPITAERAYDIGFVNRVTPAGGHVEAAMEMARAIAGAAPLVLAQLKQLSAQTIPASPIEVMYRAAAQVDIVDRSADAVEGVRAFRERREPRFQGR